MTVIKLGKTWDNATRMRGTGRNSMLLRRNTGDGRKQCCVGVALTQLGVPDTALDKNGYAEDIPFKLIPEPLKWMVDTISGVYRSSITYEIYSINDEPDPIGHSTDYISDEDRVERLNRISEPHGIRFELVKEGEEE